MMIYLNEQITSLSYLRNQKFNFQKLRIILPIFRKVLVISFENNDQSVRILMKMQG